MRKSWMFFIVLGGLLSGPLFLAAQEPPPDGPPPHEEGMPGGPLGPRMQVLGFEEMHTGKVVTGTPYSAVTTMETMQTLADGTTIDRKIQGNVYRDSQGRIRRDTILPAIGPLAASGQAKTFVLLHDPVAGTAYELRPDKKMAVQLPARPGGKNSPDAMQNKFEQHIQQEIANGTLKKEDLGTQNINGLPAQGTRYTRVIPAGQIGNNKPLTIVNERWYSPDLQIVVKSTRSDPRFGTTSYAVTNVQRQEPAASLFKVPSDYTVKGHGSHGMKGATAPGHTDAPPPDAPPPSE